MILITASALLQGSLKEYPFTHSHIGYHTITRTSEDYISASSAKNGHPAYAAGLPNTYESWIANTLPAWIKFDAGAPVEVDYVGIAAHTIGSTGANFTVQYSTDNVSWNNAADPASFNDDTPIMMFFAPQTARYWRLLVNGTTPPIMSVIYIGKALAMQRAIYGGHTPITLSRATKLSPQRSESGQFLGRYIVRGGVQSSAGFRYLTASWYREHFDPFVLSARKFPFFFAWRPADFPREVAYAWTTGDIKPTNMGKRDFMEVSWQMEGIGRYE